MSWYPIIAIVALAVTWVLYQLWQRRVPRLDFPTVGSPSDMDFAPAVIEGYRKYPDTPFYIPVEPPRLMLPMSMHDEVNHAPDEKISLRHETYEQFMGYYTGVGQDRPDVQRVIRHDLTQSLSDIIPLLQEECAYAVEKELGRPEDWTVMPLYPKLLRMVALLSSRVFVGMPLSRDEQWLNLSINITAELSGLVKASGMYNSLLRPILAPFIPEVRKVQASMAKARKFMEPFVEEIMSGYNKDKPAAVHVGDRGTFISWLMNYLPMNANTAERVGSAQMLISFAAIHTTTMTAAHAILDLVARPEYIKPLRDEVEAVIAEDGLQLDANGNPYLPKSSIAKLKKLDSFIKESQRLGPLGFSATGRRVLKDYTFSNGLTIPKGTRIAFPMYGRYHSEDTPTFSPEYNAPAGVPGPEVFDGFRFAKLRAVPGRETYHQAVTTGPDSLNFGHGPHACPGRFFAMYEIKTIVLELVRNYDLRIKGDVEGTGGADKRPKNVHHKLGITPNFAAMLEVRARQT